MAIGGLEAMEAGLLDALALLQVESPLVVIIAPCSESEKRGEPEKKAFEALGIQKITILPSLDGEDTKALVDQADVVWLGDGSPALLMRQLAASGLISQFHESHKKGALIGANGATAGVLGFVYIEGLIEEPYMTHLSVKPRRGLGLWGGLMLTDMHTDNRLAHGISAVMDQNRLVGLAQDRRSAVRIQGDDMFFTGKGSTILIDARKASKTWIDKDTTHSLRDVKLHSFAFGETFTWFQ